MRQVLLTSCVSTLLLGACAQGPDVPPPTFSVEVQRQFDFYLSGKLGPPMAFIVSEDGEHYHWIYCPQYADHCLDASQSGGTVAKGIKQCEQEADTPCHLYARGKRVVWTSTSAPSSVQVAIAHYRRGLAAHERGDYDQAIRDYTEAIRINPENADAYYSRGFAYHRKGDYDEEIRDYDQAILINPNYAKAYDARGLAHHNKGDYARAIQDYNEAIRISPEDANAYNNRCWTYGLMRRPDDALRDCNESLRLRPNDAGTLDSRALAHWLRDDQDRARKDLQRARKINPSLPTWQKRFLEFEELAAGTTGADVSEAERQAYEHIPEQASIPLPNFDGEWIFEIIEGPSPSSADRHVVEVLGHSFTVKVSTNGWRGTISGEIDQFGSLKGKGTLKKLGQPPTSLDFSARQSKGSFHLTTVGSSFWQSPPSFTISLNRE